MRLIRPAERSGGCLRHLLLQWHITERCNLRCAHCYQEAYSGDELEFEKLIGVMDQFKDLLKLLKARGHITVTGGEPFIRSDFLALLEEMAKNKDCFSFAILTNGTFIDESMAHRLHELGPAFVQVSVEGSESTHDSIRGKGNFRRTVSAVRSLVKERLRTFISFTAHRANFREFGEVAELGRRLHVARVWADRIIPHGSGSSMSMLGPEETHELFEIMKRERKRGGIFCRTEISMHRALQFLESGGRPYHCTAGDTLITVQPNGDLYPCRRMPIRVGNVMETPMAELYNGSQLFHALRTRISDGCRECFYSGACRGGLRCLSYAVTGNPFTADPGCWHAGKFNITA